MLERWYIPLVTELCVHTLNYENRGWLKELWMKNLLWCVCDCSRGIYSMPLLYITGSVEQGFAIRLHTHCYSTVKEACCMVGCHKATCLFADAHMPKTLEGRSGIFRFSSWKAIWLSTIHHKWPSWKLNIRRCEGSGESKKKLSNISAIIVQIKPHTHTDTHTHTHTHTHKTITTWCPNSGHVVTPYGMK